MTHRVHRVVRAFLAAGVSALMFLPGMSLSPALADPEIRTSSPSALFTQPFLVRSDDDDRNRERPGTEDDSDGIDRRDHRDHWEPDGPRQVVKLFNRTDDRLRVRGKIELNTIRGGEVTPVNLAEARATCVDCQTFSVALQINIYERGAPTVAPVNRGVVLNEHCTRCITVARAVQYVIPADEPNRVPDRAESLIRDLERELRRVHSESNRISAAEANQRIQAVLEEFNDLGQSLLSAAAVQTGEDGEDDSELSPGPKIVPGDLPPSAAPTPTPTPVIAEPTATPTPGTSEPTATPTPAPAPMP